MIQEQQQQLLAYVATDSQLLEEALYLKVSVTEESIVNLLLSI